MESCHALCVASFPHSLFFWTDRCPLQANINGRVLSQCNLDELKKEMEMNFGDWQLFRSTVRLKFVPLLFYTRV